MSQIKSMRAPNRKASLSEVELRGAQVGLAEGESVNVGWIAAMLGWWTASAATKGTDFADIAPLLAILSGT